MQESEFKVTSESPVSHFVCDVTASDRGRTQVENRWKPVSKGSKNRSKAWPRGRHIVSLRLTIEPYGHIIIAQVSLRGQVW